MNALSLSRATLHSLDPRVAVPRYDPAAVTAGIVHLGLGGFHRAHMARYTHDLMHRDGDAPGWGIVGAGLLPSDRRIIDALASQDGLYTLVERQGDEERIGVIATIPQVIFAGKDSAALIEAIERPEIRIVSLTVTEHGYCLNRATRRLDPMHPVIAAALAAPPRPPRAIGTIVEALRRRRAAGRPAFTAMSCDNIQHNGAVLKGAVLDYAALIDADLAAWIAAEARFPATMVDRITPVTTPADIADLTAHYGVAGKWPVVAETFRQWVIEDEFADGRRDRADLAAGAGRRPRRLSGDAGRALRQPAHRRHGRAGEHRRRAQLSARSRARPAGVWRGHRPARAGGGGVAPPRARRG